METKHIISHKSRILILSFYLLSFFGTVPAYLLLSGENAGRMEDSGQEKKVGRISGSQSRASLALTVGVSQNGAGIGLMASAK